MDEDLWLLDAACATATWFNPASGEEEPFDYFTTNDIERQLAQAVCFSQCPVRLQCMQLALDKRIIHGIWGGVDEYEIRRALSVNSRGEPTVRARPPRCPYCKNRKLEIGEPVRRKVHVHCPECTLEWTLPVSSLDKDGNVGKRPRAKRKPRKTMGMERAVAIA